MTEFAQNYGALIFAGISTFASCATLFIAWHARKAWQRQKMVAVAEKYADALYQRAKSMQVVFCQSLIDDVNNTTYTNDKISTMEKESLQVLHVEKKLLRIEYIFPDLKNDMHDFNKALHVFAKEVDKIIAKFPAPESMSADRKEALIMEIHELFMRSVATQRIDSIHQKINNYLSDYIARNLK